MKISDIISTSFLNLARQKVRALLTTTAIIVGALLITLMVSIGNGLNNFISSQVKAFTTPITISVNPKTGAEEAMGMFGLGGGPQEYKETSGADTVDSVFSGMKFFSAEEIDSIGKLEHVEEVAILFNISINYVELENQETKYQAYAMYMPEFQSTNVTISEGRYVKESSDAEAVISQELAEKWGYSGKLADLIGKKIVLNATQLTEAGMLNEGLKPLAENQTPESKDYELEIVGISQKSLISSIIFVSRETAIEIARFQANNPDLFKDNSVGIYEVSVRVDKAENVKDVDKEIEDLGFRSTTYDDMLGQLGSIFSVINIVLSTFGIIALVVAALGIINTMMMAIYERTKEIGIMKSVGAKESDISTLFTVEAGLIGFFGGVIGVIIGAGIGQIGNWILHKYFFLKDYPALNISIVNINLILMVIGVTVGIALFSGLYPAYRAAKLDPIDALRHE